MTYTLVYKLIKTASPINTLLTTGQGLGYATAADGLIGAGQMIAPVLSPRAVAGRMAGPMAAYLAGRTWNNRINLSADLMYNYYKDMNSYPSRGLSKLHLKQLLLNTKKNGYPSTADFFFGGSGPGVRHLTKGLGQDILNAGMDASKALIK